MLFNILVLVLLVSNSVVVANHCSPQLNISVIKRLEVLAESYHFEQQDERGMHVAKEFKVIGQNFPCLMGTIPVGGADKEGILDGHKFSCGIHVISGPPIVYSYGSHRDHSFEKAFLELRPDAEIHVFEISADQLPEVRDPRIHYHAIGLGGYDGKATTPEGYTMRTMVNTMKKLRHSYIDVVKMDIEGHEYLWLRHEIDVVGPRIGQLLVEIHLHTPMAKQVYPGENAVTFITTLEQKANLRVFHQEINRQAAAYCTELSLIQSRWTLFEENKRQMVPLIKEPSNHHNGTKSATETTTF